MEDEGGIAWFVFIASLGFSNRASNRCVGIVFVFYLAGFCSLAQCLVTYVVILSEVEGSYALAFKILR